MSIMMLRWLQKTGNRPIALMGGVLVVLDNAFILETRVLLFDGILVASTLEPLLMLEAMRAGVSECIQEPVTPQALEQAIGTAGYHGRIVIGSWYGDKTAALQLGGRFHRDRLRLISSQVSTLAPELSGRWTKARRFQVAWEMLAEIKPSRFITHRFPLRRASEAYHLLDQTPEESIQVIFTY